MTLLRSAKGQATFESTMLLFIIFLVWIGLTGAIRKMNFFGTLFGTPWARLTNVMEFGIPTDQRTKYSAKHPTSFDRHSTRLNEGQP